MKLAHATVACTFSVPSLDPQDTEFGKGYTFSGHGAAWAKDLAGNILVKGAFQPSIEQRVPNRMVKIRWMHTDPMGFVTSAKEDDIGLYIEAFVPSTPMNTERMALMQAGVVDKMSIGFDPDYESITYTDSTRIIPKLTLYEVSAVDLPLNEATDVDNIQALGMTEINGQKFYIFGNGFKMPSDKEMETFVGATLNSANMSLLKSAHDNIGKVLNSAKKDAKEEDNKDEETDDKKDDKKDAKKEEHDSGEITTLSNQEMEMMQVSLLGFQMGLHKVS
jgi:HK97 family phage prohead protease